jgi:outer membrane protein assembly factor BamA
LRVGAPFNRRYLQSSIDTIRTRLRGVGHPFAEVFVSFREDRQNRVARVTLDVDPSMFVRVGEVEVIGADKIDADVVRGLIAVAPGQTFDARRLYDSQIDLYRLGVYDRASISLVDTVPPEDSLVTVRARLAEGDLRSIRLGAGYGTTDCFRATGRWTLNNFGGAGRRLTLSSRVSRIGVGETGNLETRLICRPLAEEKPELLTLNYNLIANIFQPAFLSRRMSGTISVFGERVSEFQAYRRDAVGFELVVTQQLAINLPFSIAYSLSRGRTFADPATQCQFLNQCIEAENEIFNQRRTTSKVTFAIVHEDRNSILDPTRGRFVTAQLSVAHPMIGSDSLSQFVKGIVEYASHHPVGRDRTFSWRVRAGAMWAPEIEIDGVVSRYAPPEERFFAGGATTVRGVGQNQLGPLVYVTDSMAIQRDTIARTSPVGGNGLLLANIEYRLPVGGSSNLVAAAFIDAGAVFNFRSLGTESPASIVETRRISPGVGMRLGSPLGPIRFDVALSLFEAQKGPLYLEYLDSDDQRVLERVPLPGDNLFQPPKGFLGPFRIHISIGQAF